MYNQKEAFEKAVDWAINQNLLEGLFKKYRAEVLDMMLTEYDEDFNNKTWYEDGVEDGILKGKQEKALEDAENFLKEGIKVETVARCTGLPLKQIQELQRKYLEMHNTKQRKTPLTELSTKVANRHP